MFKKYAKIAALALLAALVLSCAAVAAPKAKVVKAAKQPAFKTVYLKCPGWEPHAKAIINQMFDMYGKASPNYNPKLRPYAAFDWDNSISILDVYEQMLIYQLEHLRFAIKPAQMYEVLVTGVPDINKDCGEDYSHQTVANAAKDAAAAYAKLYAKGLVKADASQQKHMKEWMATDDWKEFATKVRWLYDAIGDTYSVDVSYPWITYLTTGMTPKQVQQLAYESHVYYSTLVKKDPTQWKKCTWESPANYPGAVAGQLKIEFNQGITVTPELKELIADLDANGIDMWVCSASFRNIIVPAVKAFGLKGVDGVVGMENKMKDGKFINVYDFDVHAQPQGLGKSEAIVQVIAPKYKGHGPVLVVFDSQGDFNFVTEFKDTAVGLCLNRARKDDAGLCAAVALWQDKHNIDLKKAQEMGDTRYVLQGRNENIGQLWPKNQVLRLGKNKEELLSSKAQKWFDMLESGEKTPRTLINSCMELTGKLKKYIGYKTR
jgi:predicted peroxiredoxin